MTVVNATVVHAILAALVRYTCVPALLQAYQFTEHPSMVLD